MESKPNHKRACSSPIHSFGFVKPSFKKSIDLLLNSSKNIRDNGLLALKEAFSQLTSLTDLHLKLEKYLAPLLGSTYKTLLSCSEVSDIGFSMFSEAFKNLDGLQNLSLSLTK